MTKLSSEQERENRFYAVAFFGSLLLPLFGVYLLVVHSGSHWPHANLLTWYAVVTGALFIAAARRGAALGPFLFLAAVHVFLLTPELALRGAGFRYESGMQMVDGTAERFTRWTRDGELFWTLPQGPGVNAQGFKTRSLPTEPDPKILRIWVQGDSVSQQGYPEIAEMELNLGNPERRFDVFNFSLAGYSSYQGRRLVERLGESPGQAPKMDVAFIAYGWNDHWSALGLPDHELDIEKSTSTVDRFAEQLQRRLRLVQGLRFLLSPNPRDTEALRVPVERFQENLAFIGDFWRRRGAVPVLVTLPSCHRVCGVPDHLHREGFVRPGEDVVALHRSFTEAVRDVAGSRGWPLLDLEADVEGMAE